jgi:pyruvate/2-oxoglutarate dehydrogenase complex dihydrolipoamide dehydrogenase (E3) component
MRSFISQASLKECSTGKITVSETESARRRIARRVPMIVKRETHLVRSQFNGNRIAALDGIGRFVDPHTLEIISP